MASIVEIVAKFINEASKGLQDVKRDVADLEGQEKNAAGTSDDLTDSFLENALAGVTVGAAFAAVVAGVKATIDAYGEAEVVGAQVNAVLRSTGGAAGVTAEEVDTLAESLSKMSGMDDEAIKRGEALMLTFTKVGKEVFPQATEAALNMSMAMGTDLQSSIIQVGKALNDPIQGATALRRVGVQLTDQQEEQIKAFMDVNDLASAQGIILNELQTEFGGVAQMMGDTTVGATNKLKVAWGNLLEELGKEPAGGWRSASDQMTEFLEKETDVVRVQREMEEAVDSGRISVEQYNVAYDKLGRSLNDGVSIGEAYLTMERELNDVLSKDEVGKMAEIYRESAQGMREYLETTTEVFDAQSELVISMEAVKAGIQGVIQDAYGRYTDKLTDLQTKHAELQSDLDFLNTYGWSPSRKTVDELTTALAENEQAQLDAAAAMQSAIEKMIFQQASAGLDAAAQLELARAMGMIDEESYLVATATQAIKKQFDDGQISAQEYAQKVADLRDTINGLKSKDITITVNQILRTQYGYAGFNQGELDQIGYAGGGIATGPESGHMEMLHGTEAVIPLERGSIPVQITGGSLGGVQNFYITLQVSAVMNNLDEQNAQNALLPMFIEAYHQARAQGAIDD